MKYSLCALTLALGATLLCGAEDTQKISLFDGKTFQGWTGDTNHTWRIEDGAFVGGSMEKPVPHNEFLRSQETFTNFVLHLKVKLVGKSGFINGGVQVRSRPVANPPYELSGYQADMGAGWWGCLYDESRRNKVLQRPDAADVANALKPNEWNEYTIRCEGPHLQTWINGTRMVDYTEPDSSIPQSGILGLQIHGGGPAEASYKDITIEILP